MNRANQKRGRARGIGGQLKISKGHDNLVMGQMMQRLLGHGRIVLEGDPEAVPLGRAGRRRRAAGGRLVGAACGKLMGAACGRLILRLQKGREAQRLLRRRPGAFDNPSLTHAGDILQHLVQVGADLGERLQVDQRETVGLNITPLTI